jgi:hypothetical protein
MQHYFQQVEFAVYDMLLLWQDWPELEWYEIYILAVAMLTNVIHNFTESF